MLNEIVDDYRNVVILFMDFIDVDIFEYKGFSLNNVFVGGFDFDLYFVWRMMLDRE